MLPSDTAILDDPSLFAAPAGGSKRVAYSVDNWTTKGTGLGRPAHDYEQDEVDSGVVNNDDETENDIGPASIYRDTREVKQDYTHSIPLFLNEASKRSYGQAPHIYVVNENLFVKEGEPFEIRFEIFGSIPIDTKWYWHHEDGPLIDISDDAKYQYESFEPENGRRDGSKDEIGKEGAVVTRILRRDVAAIVDEGYFMIMARNEFGSSLLKTKLNILRLEPVTEGGDVPAIKRKQVVVKSSTKIRLTSLKEQELAAKRVIEAIETTDIASSSYLPPEPVLREVQTNQHNTSGLVPTSAAAAPAQAAQKTKKEELKPLQIQKTSVRVAAAAPQRENQLISDVIPEEPELEVETGTYERQNAAWNLSTARPLSATFTQPTEHDVMLSPNEFAVGWDAVRVAEDAAKEDTLKKIFRRPDPRAELKAASNEESFNWMGTKNFWETKMRDTNSQNMTPTRSGETRKSVPARSSAQQVEVVNRKSHGADGSEGEKVEKINIRNSVQFWEKRIDDEKESRPSRPSSVNDGRSTPTISTDFGTASSRDLLAVKIADSPQKETEIASPVSLTNQESDGMQIDANATAALATAVKAIPAPVASVEEPIKAAVERAESDESNVVMRKRPTVVVKNDSAPKVTTQRTSRVRSVAAPKKKLLVLPFETLPEEQSSTARRSITATEDDRRTESDFSALASPRRDGDEHEAQKNQSDAIHEVPDVSIDGSVYNTLGGSEVSESEQVPRSDNRSENEQPATPETVVFGPKVIDPTRYKDFYLGGSHHGRRGSIIIGTDPGSLTQPLSSYGSLKPDEFSDNQDAGTTDSSSARNAYDGNSQGNQEGRKPGSRPQSRAAQPITDEEPEFRKVKLRQSGILQSMIDKESANRQ